MLCKNKKTKDLFSVGNTFEFKGDSLLILNPLPSAILKGEGLILIEKERFHILYEPVKTNPLIFHMREYKNEMPFACVVITDPTTYYFSKVHPKDSYNKKIAVKTALDNKSFTYRELLDYVENLHFKYDNTHWNYYKKEILLDKIKELPVLSRRFFCR